MTEIKLVCLDFDGTIMCYDDDPPTFHPSAIETLNKLNDVGIAWCTNSGRNYIDQQEVLERAVAKGLRHWPRALLCSESLIFPRTDTRQYISQEPWNSQINHYVRTLQERVLELITPVLAEMSTERKPELHFNAHYTAFNVLAPDDAPAIFYEQLCKQLIEIQDIIITRNGPWINILPRVSGKGNTLREYARLSGYDLNHVLAIGDHLNDLNMLDGTSARHVGCPFDAVEEVKMAVQSANGTIAINPGPLGTVEIIGKHCF
jgi:hydroxymethylpyrimidine pyrophosphatase-like HAD family hydrolase